MNLLTNVYIRSRKAGIPSDRSNRSKTVYLGSGHFLRISDHELGYADYGSRRQFHSGAEIIVDENESPAEVFQAALQEVRDYLREYPQSKEEINWHCNRKDLAKLLRGLRLALRRATDPQAVRRSAKRKAEREARKARRMKKEEVYAFQRKLKFSYELSVKASLARALAEYAREEWSEWAEKQPTSQLIARSMVDLGMEFQHGLRPKDLLKAAERIAVCHN